MLVKKMKRWVLGLLMVCLAATAFAAPRTQTQLLLSAETVKAGDTVWVGIQMNMPPKWHVYWRNSGDAGVPVRVQWTLPKGLQAGEIEWPVPEKLTDKAGDFSLVTYVYHGQVVLAVPVKVGADVPPGPVDIKGAVSWQECEQVCVQGKAEIEGRLTVAAETKASGSAAVIEEWRKRVPGKAEPAPARAFWEAKDPETRALVIEWDAQVASPDFYPYKLAEVDVLGDTEPLAGEAGKIRLRKTVKKLEGNWPGSISGVLVANAGKPERSGIEVTLPIATNGAAETGAAADPNAASNNASGGGGLALMLVFALLGGLILNVMPCVLPVVALKILGFVNQSKEEPGRVRKLGAVYGVGVLVSFVALALLAIAVQQAGGIADWGTAFRNPQFRLIMTVVITLVSLNLFGVFEVTLGGRTMDSVGQLTSKQGYTGAFFNGVLATVLATPCTAPFLGAATAFAFTQPPLTIILIFVCVGIGLALPFLVLCWNPVLLGFLPRPGAWMERFKVAMGFPMMATAVWLFWFTATRLGKDGVLWLGLFLVIVALAAWVWGEFVQRARSYRTAGVVTAVVLAGFGYVSLLEGKLQWRSPARTEQAKIEWQTWSPEAVEKARRAGHPVLVDFTADTCLNCQFNKLTSIEIDSTRAKLKELGVVALVGDYTDENPAIAKELQRYGRGGVPLVLVYPSRLEASPIVLPPLLTPSMVHTALEEAAK